MLAGIHSSKAKKDMFYFRCLTLLFLRTVNRKRLRGVEQVSCLKASRVAINWARNVAFVTFAFFFPSRSSKTNNFGTHEQWQVKLSEVNNALLLDSLWN